MRIGIAQRRARLGVRHLLSARAATVAEATEAVLALHATDPASVYLAAAARARVEPADVDRALYEDRGLVRMLGMRRTVFVVPRDLVPTVQASATDAIAVRQRSGLVAALRAEGMADPGRWLDEVADSTARALLIRGESVAADLAADEPRLRTTITTARGKPYEATGYITSRVLLMLSAQGRIVRGRPRGSWLSSQYSWVPTEQWLPGLTRIPAERARVDLVRRWLAAFGPGTVADLTWWTGWTVTQVRKALAGLDIVPVDLDGVEGILLASDVEPVSQPQPWAALLPALDPTAMGWKGREFYLGEHEKPLFDRTGNIGPTVWCDGRIVGGWAQRADGEVVYRLLEDVGADHLRLIEAEVDRLTAWFGEIRVTPRFRTPMEKDLG